MSKDNSTGVERSTWRKVWNIVSIVLVAIVVLAAVLLMGAKVIGLRTYNVISNSMSPKYVKGDLIYVRPVDVEDIPQEIKEGDVISFVMDPDKPEDDVDEAKKKSGDLLVATHRVWRMDVENSRIITKGDANPSPDVEPRHFKNVIGKVVFKLPLLGDVADWVQNPPGTYIAVTVGAVLLILVFLPDMIGKRVKAKTGQNVIVEDVPPAEDKPDGDDNFQ